MKRNEKEINVAIIGNPNVGKSALFNALTGLSQHVANWPGKTVEIAKGKFKYKNFTINIVDLPGIYSLSTFSGEEEVVVEYLTKEKPDVIINVVDGTNLERNLFLTTQIAEYKIPLIVAFNQNDIVEEEGFCINEKKFTRQSGLIAVKISATKKIGLNKLINKLINIYEKKEFSKIRLKFSRDTEKVINKISKILGNRILAIEILENRKIKDIEISNENKEKIVRIIKDFEEKAGEFTYLVLTRERYDYINKIIKEVLIRKVKNKKEGELCEILDEILTHKTIGYLFLIIFILTLFFLVFFVGSWLSNKLTSIIESIFAYSIGTSYQKDINSIIINGIIGGAIATTTLVIPYIIPFYLMLSVLEDSGYLARITYLLNSFARLFGLHGKSIIPIILGYGCSVPACLGCKILENKKDRIITTYVSTIVPCAGKTIIIMSLAGTFLGWQWALAIYLFNLFVGLIIAKIMSVIYKGESSDLIIELPKYKIPSITNVLKQTYYRSKSIITVVFPFYILSGILLSLFIYSGYSDLINKIFLPITKNFLGLPEISATLLIAGIARKEAIVTMPVIIYGISNIGEILTKTQIVVLTIVSIFYAPCIATLEVLRREFGILETLKIATLQLILSIIIGTMIYRLLLLIGL